ncbi:hypothetical protein Phi4:1_gp025 [Cellulophaga phage phi4:1]|uniref:Uncharacterized protein n=5 Tax=Lightbulbvirus TaxID=1918522 RepID=A0A0S2MWE4_9CAUD|nr:hypothetical protein Phi4:1_gp025 [Cellulophaga phage phi4:1]YP_008241520.1 hypothetical protein Phi17:2_gp025 [Cellulophaga phage phi17:2]ALO80034.1 hypothetical protein Phi4113_025 [Cellulophaga phage phi4:1_13]ALO80231.1 hypothetical protein Phi4118_025 [Cellulophaga phage phi4:1_18]ALO80428.1 hypothetical protein Phi17218_025 [Cellulophaga phage phi17:2_18]AGO47558.1 hypothetical protein Phi17:2_gp025 [Cellulophaga phage phi17:2]AGO49438.1 hypothetical protein Phi4:1_gp025 [Cellulophag
MIEILIELLGEIPTTAAVTGEKGWAAIVLIILIIAICVGIFYIS